MENNFKQFAPKGRTKLVSGSVIQPELSGLRLVVVPCSETGKPDTILHGIVDKKWSIAGRELKGWFAHHLDFKLGNIRTTAVQSDTWVIHMLCYNKDNQLNSLAVEACIKKISALAVSEKASVHFAAPTLEMIPQLGDLVTTYLLGKGIHTYFYEEPAMAAAMKVANALAVEAETSVTAMMAEELAPIVAEPVVKKAAPKSKKKVSKKPARKPVAKKPAVVAQSVEAAPVEVSHDEIRGQTQEVVMLDEATFDAHDAAFIEDLSKLDE